MENREAHDLNASVAKNLTSESEALKNEARRICSACAAHQSVFLNLYALHHLEGGQFEQLLKALSLEMPKSYRLLVDQFVVEITNGEQPLSALLRIPRLLPGNTAAIFALAAEQSNLEFLLNQILEFNGQWQFQNEDPRQQLLWSMFRHGLNYAFGFCVLLLIMIKVVPDLKDLFEECELQPPAAFELLVYLVDLSFKFWFLFLPLLFLIFGPVLLKFGLTGLKAWNPHFWHTSESSNRSQTRRLFAFAAMSGASLSETACQLLKLNPKK